MLLCLFMVSLSDIGFNTHRFLLFNLQTNTYKVSILPLVKKPSFSPVENPWADFQDL